MLVGAEHLDVEARVAVILALREERTQLLPKSRACTVTLKNGGIAWRTSS
jgi:hypothetical protein